MPRQARTNRSIDALGNELRIDSGVVEKFPTNRRNTVENASFCEFWRKTWKKTKTALAFRLRILTPSLTWHNPHGEAKGGGIAAFKSKCPKVLIWLKLFSIVFQTIFKRVWKDFQLILNRFSTAFQPCFKLIHTLIFTSKRVKYAIFTAISCPRASKFSGFRPPASFWQVRLGVRKLNLCPVHFYT